MITEYEQGDIMECPHCGETFELEQILAEELDDFDEFFEHVSTCDAQFE